MKKVVFLFVFALLLGCSKDEKSKDQVPVGMEHLIGTWVTMESKEVVTANDSSVFQPVEAEDKYSYQFKSDLTVIAKDIFPNIIHEGTFVINADELKLDFGNEEGPLSLYIKSLDEDELMIFRANGFEGIAIKFEKQEK